MDVARVIPGSELVRDVAKVRKTADKIDLFRRTFRGRTDVYGTYDLRTGRVRQVKKSVTRDVILAHLRGEAPYGVYLLIDDRTHAVVADFDLSLIHI